MAACVRQLRGHGATATAKGRGAVGSAPPGHTVNGALFEHWKIHCFWCHEEMPRGGGPPNMTTRLICNIREMDVDRPKDHKTHMQHQGEGWGATRTCHHEEMPRGGGPPKGPLDLSATSGRWMWTAKRTTRLKCNIRGHQLPVQHSYHE